MQIITYGSMAAKAVVRDVGRVMGQPYGFVDRIAKAVPFEIGMTLSKALEESDDLKKAYKEDDEVTAMIDMALSIDDLVRAHDLIATMPDEWEPDLVRQLVDAAVARDWPNVGRLTAGFDGW